ncbi:MAG TPA: hypothetical protein VK928_06490, partial [Longimicrobiales bacterium]|nr:hypothetical protein [Longimicrobiales bacterium]
AGSAEDVARNLTAEPEMPLKPEPRPVDRLREYSNYLTPRLGLMSGDTGAAIAIVLRNILLNWIVVVPLLTVIVAIPLIVVQLSATRALVPPAALIATALVLATLALTAVQLERLALHKDQDATDHVLRRGIAPFVLSAFLLATGVAWLADPAMLPVLAALWCLAVPLAAFALASLALQLMRRDAPSDAAHADRAAAPLHNDQSATPATAELFALLVSGAIAATLLAGIGAAASNAFTTGPRVYVLLAAPVLLAVHLVARTLHVAIVDWACARWGPHHHRAGAAEDAAREWWARYSGYLMTTLAGWLAIGALSIFGWDLAHSALDRWAPHALAGAGGIAGLVAALAGGRGETGTGRSASGGGGSRFQKLALALAAPLFCIALVPLLARGYLVMAAATGAAERDGAVSLLLFLAPAALLTAVSALAGFIVNVNRFSLHGFYRNRLVRAYLGASNTQRSPDPFTGFDIHDNVKMSALWPREPNAPRTGPFHVVNTTLNLVSGQRLAWQQRKAESFSISPLYCGNFYEGYRRTREYGGRGGITLGTAIAISGAAANPNMGYHSSPAVTFLLALFNGRLGAWLGNTNHHGRKTYRHSAPRWAVSLMLDEALGRTRADTPYVQLSDGGHFEHLGIYEMVLRRGRFIVASDVGNDPASGFEDLGNLIRKVRIDFGIDIVFDQPIRTLPRTEAGPGLACAVGRICYSTVDGSDAEDGTLLYFKPTLTSDGVVPYDVFSYSRASDTFPHESTADQWFDESQFESYRILGSHLVQRVTQGRAFGSLSDFEAAARAYVAQEPVASS